AARRAVSAGLGNGAARGRSARRTALATGDARRRARADSCDRVGAAPPGDDRPPALGVAQRSASAEKLLRRVREPQAPLHAGETQQSLHLLWTPDETELLSRFFGTLVRLDQRAEPG